MDRTVPSKQTNKQKDEVRQIIRPKQSPYATKRKEQAKAKYLCGTKLTRVSSRSSPNITGLIKKVCLKKGEIQRKFFKQFLSHLSLMVCRFPSYCVRSLMKTVLDYPSNTNQSPVSKQFFVKWIKTITIYRARLEPFSFQNLYLAHFIM